MIGQLAGILALGLIQALTFLGRPRIGAGIAAGVAGAVVIVILSLVISLAFGCIGAFAALRSGSVRPCRASSRCCSRRCSCPRSRCRAT